MVTAKRLTETEIWKRQQWFRKLESDYKLAWLYLKDSCDHAGIWKIDVSQLREDTGLTNFDLKKFIQDINTDLDPMTGTALLKERVKIIYDKYLLLTGFFIFHYQKGISTHPASHDVACVKSALKLLDSFGILEECIDKGYVTLMKPLDECSIRTKNKNKNINKNKYNIDNLEEELVIEDIITDSIEKEAAISKSSSLKKKKGKQKQDDTEDDTELGRTLIDFYTMRKSIKKPMTDRAKDLLENELSKLAGNDEQLKINILNQSIMYCWQGVFELKQEKSNGRTRIRSPGKNNSRAKYSDGKGYGIDEVY